MKYDAVVVGGGIAGLTAAAYLAKAGRSVALFEKQAKVGGMVQTFVRNDVLFDAGLRSIENSGIVFPMLRQLGIEIDFIKSRTSIGVADRVLILENRESVRDYEEFLIAEFPENAKDIHLIIREIKKIMGYMDVLYGLDNPAFIDIGKDKIYLMKVLLPWMFKFMLTIRKINRLTEPVEDYLARFTQSRALIDFIAQHFFQKTPASFALSYFSLYLDYYYPRGGTATLVDKMASFIEEHGGAISTSVSIESIHPEQKMLINDRGEQVEYDQLIWAADLKQLYNRIPLAELKDAKLLAKIERRKAELRDLKGGDSVFTVYMTVNERKEYFSAICTGHFFYTPSKVGLSALAKDTMEQFIAGEGIEPGDSEMKQRLKAYLKEYCELNTFEIALPVLRDPDLAPEDQTGLIVSLLFDYQLSKKIDELGWSKEMGEFMEQCFITVLDNSIFPGLREKVSASFSSSPLTIERLSGSTHGGITGWAFTNPVMPVVNRMLKVAKSVDTILPSVYQAGQWVYSPSGLPISILTGKLAADKVLKH